MLCFVDFEMQSGAETHIKALCVGFRHGSGNGIAVRIQTVAVFIIALDKITLFHSRLLAGVLIGNHDFGWSAAVCRQQLRRVISLFGLIAKLDRRAFGRAGFIRHIRAAVVAFDVIRGGLHLAAHGFEQVVRDQLGAVQLLRAARYLGRRPQRRAEYADDQTQQSGADHKLHQCHAFPAAQD